jgi:hypothetical protein
MGRKRKHRYRYRSGRSRVEKKPEAEDLSVRIARSQPHRRGLRSNDRPSELAESVLGRLNLRGVITATERAAGDTFAAIVAKYQRVIEGPRSVRSLMPETAPEYVRSEELVAHRFECPSQYADPLEQRVQIGTQRITVREWPCQVAGATCACRERRQRYDRLYEAIAGAGRRALMAVIRAAVRGEELPPSEIVYLKAGLEAARRALGLTDNDAER